MDDNHSGLSSHRRTNRLRRVYDNRQSWLTTPIKVILILLILAGLIFLGRWINHILKDDPSTDTPGTTQVREGAQSAPASSGAKTQTGSTGSTAGGSTNTPSSSSSSTPTTTQLPNSGPGDVAAIFLAATFAAAAAHYMITRRQSN